MATSIVLSLEYLRNHRNNLEDTFYSGSWVYPLQLPFRSVDQYQRAPETLQCIRHELFGYIRMRSAYQLMVTLRRTCKREVIGLLCNQRLVVNDHTHISK